MLIRASAKIPPRTITKFHSVRESCRQLLRASQTPKGRWVPITIAEITRQLAAAGLAVNERDVAAFLRELAASGEVVEIDCDAGFRWADTAA